MVVPGIGSLFPASKPGRLSGDGAILVTGETLQRPLLLSVAVGDFMASDSSEFLNMAAEVKFSSNDPELAIALAKNGGKLGAGGKGSLGGPGGPEEGPGPPIPSGRGNFCC